MHNMQIRYLFMSDACGYCGSEYGTPVRSWTGVPGLGYRVCEKQTCREAAADTTGLTMVKREVLATVFPGLLAVHPLLGVCQVANLDAFDRPDAPMRVRVLVKPVEAAAMPQEVPIHQLFHLEPAAQCYKVYPKPTHADAASQCDYCATNLAPITRTHIGIADPFCVDACEQCTILGCPVVSEEMHTFVIGTREAKLRKSKNWAPVPGQTASRLLGNKFSFPVQRIVDEDRLSYVAKKFVTAVCTE